jgi:plasmid stabilization system protein ParE
MRFYFHEEAETELDKAVEYYEDCRRGLGLEFAKEVYATIARIIQFPEAWSEMSKNTGRCLVNRFPYGVIYRVKSDHIQVIAVADLRHRPGYWRSRG